MTGYLAPDPQRAGLYLPNGTMVPTADGNYTTGNLIEDPDNPGLYLFGPLDPTVPQLQYLPPLGNGSYGPRVEVLVREFPYEFANLYRISGGNRVLVRGGVQRPTSGGLVVVDSEVPFGVPVTYQAGVEFEDGSGVFTAASTITLDRSVMGADYGKSWVHNVLEPSRSLEYIFTGDALSALTRTNPGTTHTPEAEMAMWMGAGQSGLQGVNVSGSTYTLEDHAILAGMFGTPQIRKLPILVFRGPPELLIPGTFFAVVPERSEVPHNVASGINEWVEWRMSADEVQPPFPGLAEPSVSWADVAARYPTASGYASAYPTFLDMSRDYSLVGLGDN